MEALGEQLHQIVMKRIASDRLVLPSMPLVASRVLTMLRDPDLNLKNVARQLERDPLIAARVIRLANSAAYGGANSSRSIEQAVMRLGAGKLKALLVDLSAKQVFESRDRAIAAAFNGLWEHSVAVALLARDVATLTGNQEPESAYLAGLLHDVGKPVVAAMLLEAEKSLGMGRDGWITSDAWMSTVEKTHRSVGVALAEKWMLPEAVFKSIRDCSEYDVADRGSVANIVRWSNATAKVGGLYTGTVDKESAEALTMIGRSLLDLDESVVQRLATGLKERVAAATA